MTPHDTYTEVSLYSSLSLSPIEPKHFLVFSYIYNTVLPLLGLVLSLDSSPTNSPNFLFSFAPLHIYESLFRQPALLSKRPIWAFFSFVASFSSFLLLAILRFKLQCPLFFFFCSLFSSSRSLLLSLYSGSQVYMYPFYSFSLSLSRSQF
jgi:hypothetical protein